VQGRLSTVQSAARACVYTRATPVLDPVRFESILMLVGYATFLLFQLVTHKCAARQGCHLRISKPVVTFHVVSPKAMCV
jgi:Ca2+/H+ antiporter